jgi:hypothetical protein
MPICAMKQQGPRLVWLSVLTEPHTLVEVRAGLRAGEVAGWAFTIAMTCSEFHKRREKTRLNDCGQLG